MQMFRSTVPSIRVTWLKLAPDHLNDRCASLGMICGEIAGQKHQLYTVTLPSCLCPTSPPAMSANMILAFLKATRAMHEADCQTASSAPLDELKMRARQTVTAFEPLTKALRRRRRKKSVCTATSVSNCMIECGRS